jgi:hypothetical protein
VLAHVERPGAYVVFDPDVVLERLQQLRPDVGALIAGRELRASRRSA